MKKLYKKNFFGIMFHYFHDNKIFLKSQGTISKNQFIKIINKVGRKNILDAKVFYEKLLKKKLKKTESCITFDDGLLSQYKIALPVLKKFKIKAFWFIQSSILNPSPNSLEIYRHFRNTKFKNINQFYDIFFSNVLLNKKNFKIHLKNQNNFIRKKKKTHPFYSYKDLKFRFIRDYVLTKKEYDKIMFNLFKKYNYSWKDSIKKLFLNKKHLKKLFSEGHLIGLHSHSHPTNLANLNLKKQFLEYKKNKEIFEKILKTKIVSMSHPCGDYNNNTLKVLNNLNVNIGFRSNLSPNNENLVNATNLEIAREDSSNILRKIL